MSSVLALVDDLGCWSLIAALSSVWTRRDRVASAGRGQGRNVRAETVFGRPDLPRASTTRAWGPYFPLYVSPRRVVTQWFSIVVIESWLRQERPIVVKRCTPTSKTAS